MCMIMFLVRMIIIIRYITLAHVYTSYRGFQLLESDYLYTLFHLYPIMILLSGENASYYDDVIIGCIY